MKKRTAIRIISLLLIVVAALGGYTWVNYNKAQEHEQFVKASYQHSFAELVTNMSQVDAALQKSLYATSPAVAGAICTEVFGKAMMAQMSLGRMPFSTVELEQTASFISKVGDYAYVLSRSVNEISGYTDEERENLKALSDTAGVLHQNLSQLQAEMMEGRLTFRELERAQDEMDMSEEGEAPVTMGGSMKLIEGEFPEMPSLIYDGPFSEHLTNAEPKLIADAEEISREAGRKITADFLGIQEGRVALSAIGAGILPSYQYTARTSAGETYVEVSVAGGQVVSVTSSREIHDAVLSQEDAMEAAKQFLERHGYKNMRESYFMKEDGTMTVNFAYEQDGIICYSDLVKVGIALDNGGLVFFEAKGYIMNHIERDIPAAQITVDQARKHVTPDLEILSENQVVIPSGGNYELYCYEFKCRTEEDREYIIYVNAVSGEQQKILILLEDENGALTL